MGDREADRPVTKNQEAVLGAPGRADFEKEQYVPADPNRAHRLIIGIPAAVFMVLSGLFTGTVFGYADGGHSMLFRTTFDVPEYMIAGIGLLGLWAVLKPLKPDPRVAQAMCLAAGMVSLVYGVVLFFGAVLFTPTDGLQDAFAGGQAWLLIVAGILFVYLRWNRLVWPDSPWEQHIRSVVERRAR